VASEDATSVVRGLKGIVSVRGRRSSAKRREEVSCVSPPTKSYLETVCTCGA